MFSFATIFLFLSVLLLDLSSAELYIDSFEQDGFTIQPGTPVNADRGWMKYTDLYYYRPEQVPNININGGGWIGANVAGVRPTWRLKSGGTFTPQSVDFACFSQSLSRASTCTITATGLRGGAVVATTTLSFGAIELSAQTFASAAFPDSFSGVDQVSFSAAAGGFLFPTPVLMQFDYIVYII